MKLKTNLLFVIFLLIIIAKGNCQENKFLYKRELKDVNDQWNKIILPDEIYSKTSADLSDIRVLGITKQNDTLEAPYFLRILNEHIEEKEIESTILNQSKNERGYFFTFELPSETLVNQLDLDFLQENYDWKILLEGSNNLKEWFTVVSNYRILSIKNDLTNYEFTKVTFPTSKYRYYRLLVPSKIKPELNSVKVTIQEISKGEFRNFIPVMTNVVQNKKDKETDIEILLDKKVPVSYLKISPKEEYDYYRNISVDFLTDSFETPKGWKHNYENIFKGTITSMEKNEFAFENTILQKLRITIINNDNQPLSFDSILVMGNTHQIIGRFSADADYYLFYGNKKLDKPNYDLTSFIEKIPIEISPVSIGQEEIVEGSTDIESKSSIVSKIWLWLIMGVIILLLGWFSLSMMKNTQEINNSNSNSNSRQ